MKRIVQLIAVTALFALPLSAQTYDQYIQYPTGTCTSTPAASIGISRPSRTAYSRADNTVQCTGTFNGKVTAEVAIQIQGFWLQNQNPSPTKVTVADTFYWVTKSWPTFGNNPNCTYSWCCTSCPPGEPASIVTSPIPSNTTVTTTTGGSSCFRSVARIQWLETIRYPWGASTYTRSSTSYSAWAGNGCV
jgi:hypothetical protein